VRKWSLHILLFFSLPTLAQDSSYSDDQHPEQKNYSARKWLVGGSSALGSAGSLYLLNETWYKNYPRSSFHTFNDGGEWMQMDKIGHAWTTYTTSRVVSGMWQWAGLKPSKAVLLGTASSLVYMTSIEYLDGLSADWGWSWPDIGFNIFGAAVFASQELGWKEQRIQVKFSMHRKNYPEPVLQERANNLFGQSWSERMLKDYNAQTYWMSFNMASLTGGKNIPAWLNLAVGYGAEGMFGGYENLAYDKDGNLVFDRRDIKRYRQWYLSPDIDFTRIRTNSKFLKTTFFVLNAFKFPAPSLEFSNRKLRFNLISF
jgi:uncharacterized protein YfiM (DUF2279 family)